MTREDMILAGLEFPAYNEIIEDGKLITLSDAELMERGLLPIPDGKKFESGKLIDKTELDKLLEPYGGELPQDMKIFNNNVVPKTPEELYSEGIWSKEDWVEYQKSEQINYLYSTDWVVIKTLEAQLSGKKSTHDYSDIIAEREKARAKINELEEKIETEKGGQR
jgi:hypothetical protein